MLVSWESKKKRRRKGTVMLLLLPQPQPHPHPQPHLEVGKGRAASKLSIFPFPFVPSHLLSFFHPFPFPKQRNNSSCTHTHTHTSYRVRFLGWVEWVACARCVTECCTEEVSSSPCPARIASFLFSVHAHHYIPLWGEQEAHHVSSTQKVPDKHCAHGN